jgi:hypothetical protein
MADDKDPTTQNPDEAVATPPVEEKKKRPRNVPQPEGQTIPSDGGLPQDDEYADPITAQGPGQASVQPTNTSAKDGDDEDLRKGAVAKRFRALTGVKAGDILAINEQTRVVVTAAGGKYQLNKKGDQVRQLSGPEAPKSTAIDARARSPFTGTAAAINASSHESPSGAHAEVANQAEQDAEAAQTEAELRREIAENSAAR